jgi:hypothetical protein
MKECRWVTPFVDAKGKLGWDINPLVHDGRFEIQEAAEVLRRAEAQAMARVTFHVPISLWRA